MERVQQWIRGNGVLFHAGNAQVGYPAVDIEKDTGGYLVVVKLTEGRRIETRAVGPEEAVGIANEIIRLILDAHRGSSAKAEVVA